MEIERQMATEFLAKGLVALHAPEEIEYFDQLKQQSNADLNDDDAFSFGVGEIVPTITPIAIAMAGVALNFVIAKMGEAGADILKERYKNWICGLFSGVDNLASVLSQEQRNILTQALLDAALKAGVRPDHAVKLSADFVEKVL